MFPFPSAAKAFRCGPLVDAESAALLFAAMAWNAHLLDVLLAKSPGDPAAPAAPGAAGAGAAFPSLEEAFGPGPGPGARERVRPTRSKRRKLCRRRRGTHVPLAYIYEGATDAEAWADAAGSEGVYLTEEEEVDAGQRDGRPPADMARQRDPQGNADADAGGGEGKGGKGQEGNDASSGSRTKGLEALSGAEGGGGKSIRAFLRQFYQSFVLVLAAQVRHASCAEALRDTQSLTAMESRALGFFQRHLRTMKNMLRQYVMCSDTEVRRRSAQPLLFDAFACESVGLSSANWQPQHKQVYIAGKDPVYQPLLLDALDMTRIVQCYAERSENGNSGLALNALHSWRRLLLEPDTTETEIFHSAEEWKTAQALMTQVLTPLSWEPHSTFGSYSICTARLPLTGRCALKLIIPAEDRDAYDLSSHFQEGVFRFVHGTPLFPGDSAPSAALVHCSAGMHRSSGMAIAYLLWLSAQSHGAVPHDTQCEKQILRAPSGTLSQRAAGSASYLRAARRNSPQAAESAGAETCAKSEECKKSETATVLQRCVEHVRLQRPMAVPIEAVQRQLAAYAAHLHLV